ncbi:MAG: amidohydrolase family protein [Planctomycetota bacterium]|nr:amidohydrolase family protein [Planctomycetota bacterium]
MSWIESALAFAACVLAGLSSPLGAQPTSTSPLAPPVNGVRQTEVGLIALTGATVHVSPERTIESATVVIREGVIEAVGADVKPPAGARVVDLTGKHLYAAFVEPWLEIDVAKPDARAPGRHWNDRVTPERDAASVRGLDEGTAETFRKMGFGTVGIVPRGGIFQGWSAAASTGKRPSDESAAWTGLLRSKNFQAVTFDAAGRGEEDDQYPSSLMGAIALMRQTLMDARWQEDRRKAGLERGPKNALDELAGAPRMVFSATDDLDVLRIGKVVREQGEALAKNAAVIGSGMEYQRLAPIAEDGMPIALPLSFPRTPEVASVGGVERIDLRELMAWEQAPSNPRRVDEAYAQATGDRGRVSLTTAKMRDRGEFWSNLRQAMRHGLSEERALAMLTTNPARLLGVEDRVGTIEPGKDATMLVADGPAFRAKTIKRAIWVRGVEHVLEREKTKLEGTWALTLGDVPGVEMEIDAENAITLRDTTRTIPEKTDEAKKDEAKQEDAKPDESKAEPAGEEPKKDEAKPDQAQPENKPEAKPESKPKHPSVKARNVRVDDGRIDFVFTHDEFTGPNDGGKGVFTLTGVLQDLREGDSVRENALLLGTGLRADGSRFAWKAVKKAQDAAAADAKKDDQSKDDKDKKKTAEDAMPASMLGTWRITTIDDRADLASTLTHIVVADGAVTLKAKHEGKDVEVAATDVKIEPASLAYRVDSAPAGGTGVVSVTARRLNNLLVGTLTTPDGTARAFKAARIAAPGEEPGDDDAELIEVASIPETLGLPFGPYAVTEPMPLRGSVALTNATVWTSNAKGEIIERGTVLIVDGRVAAVGTNVTIPAGVRTIDATGKHVTAGIIDAHSHTGISRGVNEGSHAATAEVRIQDVTDPDAINWYRQLAGGITSVNNLHGSANPIGGQNALNKLRWGAARPDDMHLTGPDAYSDDNPFVPGARKSTAFPGIKFALGENVKQSNWGDRFTTRYPQTRMGVETFILDRFTQAREYAAEWAKWRETPSGPAPRRNLQLEALAEILAGERLIHCHSYRQDEILMLARLSKQLGFKLGSYQHILEGYKVADAVRESARGASAFSDWWAFKVEVQDAVPQAGPIMWEQGVVVSYNSDSDELARRMNLEAAKAVKYGNDLPETEAWKFVTINPAIQLGVETLVGSLEVGKDGDVAVWSGHPMSVMSRCERTIIDGVERFSLEKDAAARANIARERERIIQKLVSEKSKAGAGSSGGTPTGDRPRGRRPRQQTDQPPTAPPQDELRAGGTLMERIRQQALEAHYLDMMRRGQDPDTHRRGVCGCDEIAVFVGQN